MQVEVAPEAIKEKYAIEREKRLRADGLAQFLDLSTSDRLSRLAHDPWIQYYDYHKTHVVKDGTRFKVVILGAGFGGLLSAARLVEAGLSQKDILLIDSAGGFGGTWYWNRYPGLMCDIESYIYMPLLEETNYVPRHRYAYGPELRRHAERIAATYGLTQRALFGSVAKEASWDDEQCEWILSVRLSPDDESAPEIKIRGSMLVMNPGLQNYPRAPKVKGIDTYRGQIFHTARWDYECTGGDPDDQRLIKLLGKKVAVVGTGATAVQVVPEVAKWAETLYVVQRTPASVDERGQKETDVRWFKEQVANNNGWQRAREENFTLQSSYEPERPHVDLVNDSWTSCLPLGVVVGGSKARHLTKDNLDDFLNGFRNIDLLQTTRVRERVDRIVTDKNTAASLKAWYNTWCKRPTFHDDYLPAFNLPHVHLLDTNGKGIDKFTEKGLVVNGTEYEVDVVILSTGFDFPLGSAPTVNARMEIYGRNGLSLSTKWNERLGTLHGLMTKGMPNLFMAHPTHGPATLNRCHMLDVGAKYMARIAKHAFELAGEDDMISVEPTGEAEEAWTQEIVAQSLPLAANIGCTPSYYNAEGEFEKPQPQDAPAQRGGLWTQGALEYDEMLERWLDSGNFEGLQITREPRSNKETRKDVESYLKEKRSR